MKDPFDTPSTNPPTHPPTPSNKTFSRFQKGLSSPVFFTCSVGLTEDQKCPSNFFILCEYIGNVYTYIYPCSKFVTNFVMGSKIWCQVGEFEFHFQNSYGEMCFWKIMLKVRCFKTTGDHRPFLSKFDVKLGILFLLQQKFWPSRYTLPPGSSAIYGRGA